MKLRKYFWGLLYGFLLIAFTLYILMDTFVITRVYTQSPTSPSEESRSVEHGGKGNKGKGNGFAEFSTEENTDSTEQEQSQSGETTGMTYRDSNISITITEYRENDTSIYVADVQVASAEYLKTALAQNAYGKNVTEKTSEIARDNNAILAINGDYYGVREKGYVLRNGILYRSSSAADQEDLVIYKDGSFSMIQENDISAEQLLSEGAEQIFSFGPALVTESTIAVSPGEEVGRAKSSNPRTAIGVIDDLHYLFVVSDGRTSESEGLSLYELAEFMQSLGSKEAYNLDGGGSTTMVFNGDIINHPTSNGRKIEERRVSDIVYIGY